MAKILKHLVFGQKKNPPAPPRPDYEGEIKAEVPKYADHEYENLPKFGSQDSSIAKFQEKVKELVVFDNYSEPADLRAELANMKSDDDYDPLYTTPIDDATNYWNEDMYCIPDDALPHSGPPPLPAPCLGTGRAANPDDSKADSASADDVYDVVPDLSDRDNDEYDEPWEWSVGARLTSSLQVSPSSPGVLSLDTEDNTNTHNTAGASSESLLSCSEGDEDEMTARQRRLYETAFDSRSTAAANSGDDVDQLMQSPVLQGDLFHRARDSVGQGQVVRAASRSSFGSTSGSSASSTPTHQPMVIARQSPRQRHLPLHFTPTERRRVTLVRDLPRSMSPQARLVPNRVNCNERKISFHQWDNASERSSSQESMNVADVAKDEQLRLNSKNERNFVLGKSDNLLFRDERRNLTANYPNNWKELANAKIENSNGFHANDQDMPLQKDDKQEDANTKKNGGHTGGVKVLPTDNARSTKSKCKSNPDSGHPPDPELKENNGQPASIPPSDEARRRPARPCSLLSNNTARTLDNVPQSPENDLRPSEEYDPPWDFKIRGGVNGSVSVPERLSQPAGGQQLPSSITHEKLESEDPQTQNLPAVVPKALPQKPSGPPSRSNLNLNLNLNSDSPRKARQNLSLNFGCAALSAVGEKVDAELALEKQGWYHGSISRLDAENLLRVLKEGSYLVRNSESSKQDYSLSLRSARGFMHMKIVHSDGRFILGQFSNPFSSIPEMIHHYSINKLPIKGAEHMSLLYPVIDQLL